MGNFFKRHRILRAHSSMRSLVRENFISINDFVVPLFIVEGTNIKEEISSMPNYFRYSLDLLEIEIKELVSLGLKSVLLFVKVPDNKKNKTASEALNPNGLMIQAIKKIKAIAPNLLIMTDVALDPFSSDGHDGIVEDGKIINDKTIEILQKMSVLHAKAGADVIAPSDMMDGRILKIREALEKEGFTNTAIMAYSAKYASAHYGPFRDALDSAPGFGDKKTYQMDFYNQKEALREATTDIQEGADIVMVKPGIAYLDVITRVSDNLNVPVAVYQVSGEYSMIKAAAQKGWLNEKEIYLEHLAAFKRAGANIIISYFAKDFAQNFNTK